MTPSKVVVRYNDGNVLKGFTSDFLPAKADFHFTTDNAPPGSKPGLIRISDLKALFFVKDFSGNPQYRDRKEFDPSRPVAGRKIKVLFTDGEVMIGATQGYQPGRPGFFLVPADPQSNIERCFVVTAATKEISFL